MSSKLRAAMLVAAPLLAVATGSLPPSMRAWYLDRYPPDDSPWAMNYSRSYPLPEPKSGEVLVNIKATSVNPIDWKFLLPWMQKLAPLQFPVVLGVDASGVVAALGPDATDRLKVGDEVWTFLGLQKMGSYADYATTREEMVRLKPNSLSFEEAASMPLVSLTSFQSLEQVNLLHPLKGKTILVLGGTGGTGSVALQLAKKHYGAAKVVTTTSHPQYAKSMGADVVINYHTTNWWDVIPNASIDCVFDTVGEAGVGPRATRKLVQGGVFVTFAFNGPVSALDPNPPPGIRQFYHEVEVNGADLDSLSTIVDSGKLKMSIAKIFELPDLLQAWKLSRGGHVLGKLAVSMSRSELLFA